MSVTMRKYKDYSFLKSFIFKSDLKQIQVLEIKGSKIAPMSRSMYAMMANTEHRGKETEFKLETLKP